MNFKNKIKFLFKKKMNMMPLSHLKKEKRATFRGRGTPITTTQMWTLVSWGLRKDSWLIIHKREATTQGNGRRIAPLMGMSYEPTEVSQAS